MSKLKKDAWTWCSHYCRLRDAIEYCKQMGIDMKQFARIEDLPVKCCTCGNVKSWIYMDAGHFIGRGLGGGSGVYFDERNLAAQCKQCNAFKQGNAQVYELFLVDKYGQDVIEELKVKHQTNSYKGQFWAIGQMYKGMYEELKNGI